MKIGGGKSLLQLGYFCEEWKNLKLLFWDDATFDKLL